ncbi:MAG: hypothetical protein A2745_01780 [Candidatus Harrisonbacteria bacterium RIFCSPHIGHO2_01_FULL_44_13]|uniref:HD/PDEase domain-containing protein n=1 Tax=Candidatus Harrisonbacteria bacterium RIFCSPLOWO2_01_FULL_44_18 TaxID=1798407 RepID=A0A1G1ZKP5_9BACT|nr:MAG: hypothetical protein A2745_01780 [Candidatus Harrisonbacteria bacterium RIFCSPHIGHO2_01_FULL_44_13]OGY65203.1 MAG: hypothetical protein A3A16_00740 [Candidatus Harrisonbacteria bacterium RIFCSPLOWO2_01_FULL_44_18]
MIFHDPFVGDIDCSEVQPIIDRPIFQRLRFIKQLGLSYLIFPFANHTRFEHSIGAYGRTQHRTRLWRKWNIIDRDMARDIEIYSLIHDIGHGPYSHVVEAVTAINHDERGLELLNGLAKVIKQCGGNLENIKRLFSHRNNLFKAVHDKNLGTEKFDYLERDAAYTNSGQPQFRELPHRVKFVRGEIVVPYQDDLLDAAIGLQAFYMDMYKNIYLQPACMVLQRLMQKLIFALMKESEITEEQLWNMTDADLDTRILNSKQAWVKAGGGVIRNRQWPRVAISLKHRRFAESEENGDNNKRRLSVFPIGARRMNGLARYFYKNPRRIAAMEREIEETFAFPQHSVLVVPATDSHRFKAQQIQVSRDGEISSLDQWRPEGVSRLNEIALSYMCVRVAVEPEFREKMASRPVSREVVKLLLSKTS